MTRRRPAYERLILRRPWLALALAAALVAGFATQLGKIKLDASADSLMLQGDPSLELYREISAEYDSEEFVLITWQPHADLLAPESLQPLRLMADELRLLKGVSSVVTVWDVPLLESPPVTPVLYLLTRAPSQPGQARYRPGTGAQGADHQPDLCRSSGQPRRHARHWRCRSTLCATRCTMTC